LNHDFIIYIYLTRIAVSNTATNDVTNCHTFTQKIFYTNI